MAGVRGGVGNKGLQALAALTGLTNLDLDSRKISDAGLPALAPLTGLRRLDLFSARVTDAGCVALRCVVTCTFDCPDLSCSNQRALLVILCCISATYVHDGIQQCNPLTILSAITACLVVFADFAVLTEVWAPASCMSLF